jgi:N utilization substance protein B
VIEELPIAPEPYAVELVLGVERLGDKVSDLLSLHATGWAVDRMPVIDRCLLKMATFELLDELEVPVAVVLDEAVELAKSYSTEDSGRFVNGVLSAIAPKVREIEPEKTSAVSPNWLE